jgi:hypothetical protein
MLDSAFVRSVALFAEPTCLPREVSRSDQDNHKPSSWSRGVVMLVMRTSSADPSTLVASSTDNGGATTCSRAATGPAQPRYTA